MTLRELAVNSFWLFVLIFFITTTISVLLVQIEMFAIRRYNKKVYKAMINTNKKETTKKM